MGSWINNAWFVGTATGIASGLLVTWIARFFLSKKDNREYQQRINSANRDVIYAVRACIPDGPIPERSVIEAITHSTARRYTLSPTDLYGPEAIVEELMKEVMDSSFLSASKKAEHCHQLSDVLREVPQTTGLSAIELIDSKRGAIAATSDKVKIAEQRKRAVNMLSALAGVSTALVIMLSMAWEDMSKFKEEFTREPKSIALAATAVTILLGIFAVMSTLDIIFMRSFRLIRKKKDDDSGSEGDRA